MSRITDTDLITQGNAQEVVPIWLYRISVDGNPANDLFYAEWDQDVSFYKTDSGVHTAQVYTAFPIKHGGIGENNTGQIDDFSVDVSNVGANGERPIQAYLEANNGLRGRKVTVRLVYEALLAATTHYIEFVYYIDSVSVTETTATFKLKSRLDLLKVRPGRRFMRNHCAWDYKGQGCWLISGASFVAPSGFTTDVSIWPNEVTSKIAKALIELKFPRIDFSVHRPVQATDYVEIEMKVDQPTYMDTDGEIGISIDGDDDDDCIYWDGLTAKGLTNSYQWIRFDLADYTEVGNDFSWQRVNYIWWRQKALPGRQITISIRDIRIVLPSQSPTFTKTWTHTELVGVTETADTGGNAEATALFAAKDLITLDDANDDLLINLKCNAPASMAATGYLEIASENDFSDALRFTDLTGLGITTGYPVSPLVIPFSSFTTQGTGLNIRNVVGLRWVQPATVGGSALTLGINGAWIRWDAGSDACNKTFLHCKYHNNTLRFGGFPNIPRKRSVSV